MTQVIDSPTKMTPKQAHDYDEVRDLAEEIFDDPDLWLETPHPLLGLRKPRKFIQDGNKIVVVDLLAAIKYGMFT